MMACSVMLQASYCVWIVDEDGGAALVNIVSDKGHNSGFKSKIEHGLN